MKSPRTIKTEEDVRFFASLDFQNQRFQVLQAYYSALFDLWEECPIHWDQKTDHMLQDQRWAVDAYATKRLYFLERDSEWMCTYTEDGKLNDLLTK